MAKLTYDEIMKMMREGITDELIENVIHKMGLNDTVAHTDINKSFSYSTKSGYEKINVNSNSKRAEDSFYGISINVNKREKLNTVKDNIEYKVSA